MSKCKCCGTKLPVGAEACPNCLVSHLPDEARPKHNIMKELWHNRPWVYLPRVFRIMSASPFKQSAGYNLWTYTRNAFKLAWKVFYRHEFGKAVYAECYKCVCMSCASRRCAATQCGLCDARHNALGTHGEATLLCGLAKSISEGI